MQDGLKCSRVSHLSSKRCRFNTYACIVRGLVTFDSWSFGDVDISFVSCWGEGRRVQGSPRVDSEHELTTICGQDDVSVEVSRCRYQIYNSLGTKHASTECARVTMDHALQIALNDSAFTYKPDAKRLKPAHEQIQTNSYDCCVPRCSCP